MAGRIRIPRGEAAGRVVEIDGELLLGRQGEGEGKIPGDVEISRAHARVYLDDDGRLTIEDVGSTNGTFVGGTRITAPRALSPGDEIRVGRTTLEVEAPRAEPPAAPARPAVPRPLVYVLIGVFVLAALGIGAVLLFTGDDEEGARPDPGAQGPPALVSAAADAGCLARDLPPEGDRVVSAETRVTYRSDPPHSGDHAEKPASDGIWETAPPMPKIVGALEQGRIVMWHKPGDEKGIRLLREVGDQSPKHMLLVPNATMDHRVAATAWGHVLGCPRINGSTAGAVRAFRDAYRDKGPTFEP